MTRKQLQTLISAGVFSAALLSGAAYADDRMAPAAGTPAPAATTPASTDNSAAPVKPKHHKHNKKMMAKHSCAAQNSCKGQGGCKTSDGGCAGKNSCKGKGGCATDGSKK
jgi:hypothetical protein